MRTRRYILPIILAVMLSAAIAPVHATVSSLTPALLTASDAPKGFGAPHYRVYLHYVKTMKVVIRQKGGGSSSATCTIDTKYPGYGFSQGIVQGFDAPKGFNLFELCGYLFTSTAGAHRAFADAQAQAKKGTALNTKYQALKVPKIGDEELALGTVDKRYHLNLYVLGIRHANAIVVIFYYGGPTYTAANLGQVMQRVNIRLP